MTHSLEPHSRRDEHWWVRFRTRATRFLRVCAKFWWVLFFSLALGLLVGAFLVFQQKPLYSSGGRMMVDGRINLKEGAVFSEELANFFGTQVELMKSAEVLNRATRRLNITRPELSPIPVALSVTQLPQTSIFLFQATGSEPRYSQAILDAIMTEYSTIKREMRSSKSENTQTAILDEISRVEREMKDNESQVLNFQKKNNVGYLEQEGNSAGSYLSTLNRQLADLKTQYKLLESLDVDAVLDKLQGDPAKAGEQAARTNDEDASTLLTDANEPEAQYLSAKQQLISLTAERDSYAKVLRPKHPQIEELNSKIKQQQALIGALRAESVERLKTRRENIGKRMANLEEVIKEWEGKALSSSQRLAEYNQLKASSDRSKALYDRLINNLHEVDVTRNVDQDLVSVLEHATNPVPIKSNVPRTLLLASTAGLALGIAVLLLIDQIEDKVFSMDEIEHQIGEHVLGQIPREKHQGKLAPLRMNDPRHAFSEGLRALRSSILYLPYEGDRPTTLLVTSAAPNEGKSTVALNLAITLALANVSVLLVDGDLRRGRLHEDLHCANGLGLADLLAGECQADNAIVNTSTPFLDLVPRGRPNDNPGELFLSDHFEKLLKEIYPHYQYIIFDSSPVMAADDSTSLAPKIDASLFVVRFGFSSLRTSRKALKLLRDRQANVLGVVCNDILSTHQDYYYYRYPEYYSIASANEKPPRLLH